MQIAIKEVQEEKLNFILLDHAAFSILLLRFLSSPPFFLLAPPSV